ncbi:hypothetical protein STEG23_026357, partial [Scotinomys teguina]
VLAFLNGRLGNLTLLPEAQEDCSDVLNLPATVPSELPFHPNSPRGCTLSSSQGLNSEKLSAGMQSQACQTG